LYKVEDNEVVFILLCKPKVILASTSINDFPIEIQDIFNEYNDIIVHDFPSEFPPMRSISHNTHLIRGASLPNKASYRMTLKRMRK